MRLHRITKTSLRPAAGYNKYYTTVLILLLKYALQWGIRLHCHVRLHWSNSPFLYLECVLRKHCWIVTLQGREGDAHSRAGRRQRI